MTPLTDTHTHIYDPGAFPEGPGEAVKRAQEAGVYRFILPNVNTQSAPHVLALHRQFPHCTHVAAGLHPCDGTDNWRQELDHILDTLSSAKPVAIGEVGIDLYWEQDTLARQLELFAAQVQLARKLSLPLIIHCRNALDPVLEVLEKHGRDIPAVFHSFTGTPADVRRIRALGDYYFGINGVVTFKSAPALRESLPEIGLDRILLETDSPYLAPVPHRGRRNESAYLPAIRDCIAAGLHLDPSEVGAITSDNATRFFSLD